MQFTTASDVMQMQEKGRANSLRRLKELVSQNAKLAVAPEFVVEFGTPAEKILQVAKTLKSDAIILGLHRKTRIGAASHMPWATAYEAACDAWCSVLTVRN